MGLGSEALRDEVRREGELEKEKGQCQSAGHCLSGVRTFFFRPENI
jgi:hypothetical protein